MTADQAGRAPHVVLVGLPGAGKSTVGRRLARRLGRSFLDLDAELERRAGRSIAAQFAEDGEPAFRAREAALSREVAAAGGPPLVLAPGGGWMANAEAREAFAGAARLVYLRVSAGVAARRLARSAEVRPLIAGAADPVRAVAALLERRGALYEAADLVVDGEAGDAAAVAAAVAAALAERAAVPTPG